jgi:hypothetical protein
MIWVCRSPISQLGVFYLNKLFLPAFAAPKGESQYPVILSRELVPLTTKCVNFKCQCVFSIHLQKNMKNRNAGIFNHVMRKSFLIFLYGYMHSKIYQGVVLWMQLHTGAENFGNVIKCGIPKRGCN